MFKEFILVKLLGVAYLFNDKKTDNESLTMSEFKIGCYKAFGSIVGAIAFAILFIWSAPYIGIAFGALCDLFA